MSTHTSSKAIYSCVNNALEVDHGGFTVVNDFEKVAEKKPDWRDFLNKKEKLFNLFCHLTKTVNSPTLGYHIYTGTGEALSTVMIPSLIISHLAMSFFIASGKTQAQTKLHKENNNHEAHDNVRLTKNFALELVKAF